MKRAARWSKSCRAKADEPSCQGADLTLRVPRFYFGRKLPVSGDGGCEKQQEDGSRV